MTAYESIQQGLEEALAFARVSDTVRPRDRAALRPASL